jgi:uncharacterized membrane protein YdjX (TVP38/TMEM64 family)
MKILRKPKYRRNIIILLMIIFISILCYLGYNYHEILLDQDALQKEIKLLGIYGPIVMVILYIIQAFTFFVFPGVIVSSVSGYLFGVFFGAVLGSIGYAIGGLLLFYVSRYVLRDYALEKANKHKDNKYIAYLFKTENYRGLIYLRLIFFTPQHMVSFLSGLTKMKPLRFFLCTLFFGYPVQLLGTSYSYLLVWFSDLNLF